MNRNLLVGIAVFALVLAAVILGFRSLGGPGRQREIREDNLTVKAISALAIKINRSWKKANGVLPKNLDRFPTDEKQDAITNAPFQYRPGTGSHYELCATFLTDNRSVGPQSLAKFWIHPKGLYCFQFDASEPLPQGVPYNYF